MTDTYKRNCLKKLGRVWKDWKNRVKARHFNPNKHDKPALLSKCPDRVEADQWPILVNYWSSKKAKVSKRILHLLTVVAYLFLFSYKISK